MTLFLIPFKFLFNEIIPGQTLQYNKKVEFLLVSDCRILFKISSHDPFIFPAQQYGCTKRIKKKKPLGLICSVDKNMNLKQARRFKALWVRQWRPLLFYFA